MIAPHLTLALARARSDDLRQAADSHRAEHRVTQPAPPVVAEQSVTLRVASTRDQELLAQLAALDCAAPPKQPVLIAEVDGRLLAALALSDGSVISDPFRPTADLVALLRARARQVVGSRLRRCGRLRSWARLCPPGCGESVDEAAPAR